MLQEWHLQTAAATSKALLRAAATFKRKPTNTTGQNSIMAEHISYIDDDEEMARRRFPPPPATFLAPPAFLESSADKEERQRQQKLIDEAKKKREDKYEEYRDLFAKDFPKGIAAHYQFLSQSIVTDLKRAIENIIPTTTNVMTHYHVMKERLLNKFGPTPKRMPKKPDASWRVSMGIIEAGISTWQPLTPLSKSSPRC
jgi:hypothetical protein